MTTRVMVRQGLGLAALGLALTLGVPVQAATQWQEVTMNAVGDRFFVDIGSLDKRGNTIWYWEYREFQQPNNALLDEEVPQEVHGAVIYRSVDCQSGIERMRRLTAYTKDKQLIKRIDYGDRGRLSQPRPGSSAAQVLKFVCTTAANGKPNPSPTASPQAQPQSPNP